MCVCVYVCRAVCKLILLKEVFEMDKSDMHLCLLALLDTLTFVSIYNFHQDCFLKISNCGYYFVFITNYDKFLPALRI